jgi:elongation factor G
MTRQVRLARIIERASSPIDTIRNIGIVAHIDAGKTTTTERILYFTGRIRETGETHEGKSAMDFDPDERKRGITINSAATHARWAGAQLNIVDTPGHVDFTAEVERSLRVLDGGIGVFCAVAGVEPQSETVWRQADKYHVPRLAFVNKMDRAGADFDAAVEAMRARLGANAVRLQLPVGAGAGFRGVVDLVESRAALYDDGSMRWTSVPAELEQQAAAARRLLEEAVAAVDEEFCARYLEGGTGVDDLKLALRRCVIARRITPVLCGATLRDKGVEPLLDAVVDYLPSPADVGSVQGFEPGTTIATRREAGVDAPFSAVAFKSVVDKQGTLTFFRVYSGRVAQGDTVLNASRGHTERVGRLYRLHADQRESISEASAGAICAMVGARSVVTGDTLCAPERPIVLSAIAFARPVLSLAITPRSQADRDKLGPALAKLALQDPTFHRRTDPETGETVVSGMGELHLEILLGRLARDHGVDVVASAPRVAYRQTLAGRVDVEGRLVKQSGGHGQFAVVRVLFEHDPAADPWTFVDAVVGGVVPRQFIASVEKGVGRGLDAGGLLGVPFIQVRATLHDGAAHTKDSSDLAFQEAGVQAVRVLEEQGALVLLEPRMTFEVQCPEADTGAVVGQLNARRASIESIDQAGERKVVRGVVPLSGMFRFATELRSLTSGRGSCSLEPHDYSVVPQAEASRIYAEARARRRK